MLGVPEHAVKASLRGLFLLPRLAVIDPALTDLLPPEVTAYTGMDALTQLIEALVSNAANPLTDGLCREGMQRAGRSLLTAYHDGAISRTRRHVRRSSVQRDRPGQRQARGGARPRGRSRRGHRASPWRSCARLLPFVMEANILALHKPRTCASILDRYDEVARILTGNASASAEDGAAWVHRTCAELRIPPLRQAGLRPQDCASIIPAAQRASSMQGNPVKLPDEVSCGSWSRRPEPSKRNHRAPEASGRTETSLKKTVEFLSWFWSPM